MVAIFIVHRIIGYKYDLMNEQYFFSGDTNFLSHIFSKSREIDKE